MVPGRRLIPRDSHLPRWQLAWRNLVSDWRNRLVGSSRFQQWASRFPLTRPVARNQAGALFDLCAGFVYSQILYTCVKVGLFELLSKGPQTLDILSRCIDLPAEATQRLVTAAVALELLELRGKDLYGLSMHGAVLAGNAGIRAMILHHRLLYDDLRDPIALLRGDMPSTALSRFWSYARSGHARELGDDQTGPYSDLMAVSQSIIAGEVLSTYSLRKHKCLLDVGGGTGTFLAEAATRWPHLRIHLFDLPAVAEQGAVNLARRGFAQRMTVTGGDFLSDSLPEGADLISLVRVIHDHDDDSVLRLLRAIHDRLPVDGTLLLAEPMAGHKHGEKAADAYFGLYLAAMGSGRARTPTEIGLLLKETGFRSLRLLENGMPMQTRVMLARR
jgi:demethylspheroidene O-methyltransferase